MNLDYKKLMPLITCGVIAVLAITSTTILGLKTFKKTDNITVASLDVIEVNYSTPTSSKLLTKEEFSAMQSAGLLTNFETYENYTTSAVGAEMSFKTSDITATGVNAEIYDLVSQNFNVWYGGMRVSPILPMAVSNVETPGRADHAVTWCSLFPSKIVPIDLLYDFDVTYVVSNNGWYTALSSEYSTRDRGCLQMSPTYGTNNEALNAQMSGTEKDKLATVDTSAYSTWVSGASSSPGDRFYLPDVCLRMTAAMQAQTVYMQKNNYVPATDMQLIAMLAASHQQSGIWYYSDHSKAIGCWRSGDLVYEWCQLISSEEMINALTDLARNSDSCFIDSNKATQLCSELGIDNFSKYSTKNIVCTYPIKVLYAYIKLCILYTE